MLLQLLEKKEAEDGSRKTEEGAAEEETADGGRRTADGEVVEVVEEADAAAETEADAEPEVGCRVRSAETGNRCGA